MKTEEQVEALIRQVTELPEEAQTELLHSLIDFRSQHLGIYQLDDREQEALARSAEDMRLERFEPDEAIEGMYARYGA